MIEALFFSQVFFYQYWSHNYYAYFWRRSSQLSTIWVFCVSSQLHLHARWMCQPLHQGDTRNTKDNGGRYKRTNIPNLIPIPVWTKRKTPELLYVFYNKFFKCTPLSHFFVQSLILFTTSNNFLVECFFLKGGRLQFKKIVISASQRVCNASLAFRVINAVSVLIRNNICLPHASVNPYKVQSSWELSHRGWSGARTHFDFTQSWESCGFNWKQLRRITQVFSSPFLLTAQLFNLKNSTDSTPLLSHHSDRGIICFEPWILIVCCCQKRNNNTKKPEHCYLVQSNSVVCA